jgi:hypothetical protein
VVLMVFTLFMASFVFTKVMTSQRVHRLVNGPPQEEMRHKDYCRSLVQLMQEEIGGFLAGRNYNDLTEDEREQLGDIRAQYFKELKGDSNGRKQLNQ